MNNKLIQISTADGLYLHGHYAPNSVKNNSNKINSNQKTAVLHIHGFEGNFYENYFVHVLADELEKQNIAFLTVNTRGNGRNTDFNTVSGDYERIGARYELLEEAHLDISAWMKFLIDEGYEKIVLQGHSLGTIKVVRYLFEGEYKDKVNKLILLAPFDKKGKMIASGRNLDVLLKKAEKKVSRGDGDKLKTAEFADIVVSFKTYVSWFKQDDLGRMFEFCSPEYEFPVLKQIKVPTKIIVGSKDEYFYQTNPDHPEEAMNLMLKHIPNAQGKIIKEAVHSFKPHEDVMAKEVSEFVKEKA